MNLLHHFIILSAALLVISCEKELDFKYNDIEPIPVIEAHLTQNGARLAITMTTPMDEPMDSTRYTDAIVTVEDITDGSLAVMTADKDGYFVSTAPGIPGHDYRLVVERDGVKYTSECQMTYPTEITGLLFQWIHMPFDNMAVLQVSFRDNPATKDDCYWVRVYRNGQPYTWTVVNDKLAVDGIIDEVITTTRQDIEEEEDDELLLDGDVVGVSVTPISRHMHDYLEALSAGGSNGPRMFDGEICLGFFLAAPVAEASTVFRPDEMSEYK